MRVAVGGTRVGAGGTRVGLGGIRVGGTRVGGTRVGGIRVGVGTKIAAASSSLSRSEASPVGSPPSPFGAPTMAIVGASSPVGAASPDGGPIISPDGSDETSGVDTPDAASDGAGRANATMTCHAKATPTMPAIRRTHATPAVDWRTGRPPKRGTASHWPEVANCRSRRLAYGEVRLAVPAAAHESRELPMTAGQSARDRPGNRIAPARGAMAGALDSTAGATACHMLPERPGMVADRGIGRASETVRKSPRV